MSSARKLARPAPPAPGAWLAVRVAAPLLPTYCFQCIESVYVTGWGFAAKREKNGVCGVGSAAASPWRGGGRWGRRGVFVVSLNVSKRRGHSVRGLLNELGVGYKGFSKEEGECCLPTGARVTGCLPSGGFGHDGGILSPPPHKKNTKKLTHTKNANARCARVSRNVARTRIGTTGTRCCCRCNLVPLISSTLLTVFGVVSFR